MFLKETRSCLRERSNNRDFGTAELSARRWREQLREGRPASALAAIRVGAAPESRASLSHPSGFPIFSPSSNARICCDRPFATFSQHCIFTEQALTGLTNDTGFKEEQTARKTRLPAKGARLERLKNVHNQLKRESID